MIIRRATYDEAKAIKGWDVFIGDRRIDNSRGELFVAIDNTELLGYIHYSSNLFYNKPFISLLCVQQAHQRKGVALALMKQVVDLYMGLDVWVSTEEWNAPAISLFEKMGFENKGSIKGLNNDDSNEFFFVLHSLQ